MTTFEWLLIGHLLGDWVLQNDWMAQNKQNGLFNRAIAIHAAVYTIILVFTLGIAHRDAAAAPPYLAFAGAVFISHWIIDASNLGLRWNRFFNQSELLFMRIAVDQILHLVVLAILVEWMVG
ncbi:MAG: DUF3307 domain-containing protein [Caldilineae bacterium]|nr:MAG: DUF3307 domain-containing protein [Caldilineae bacterium]